MVVHEYHVDLEDLALENTIVALHGLMKSSKVPDMDLGCNIQSMMCGFHGYHWLMYLR